MIKRQIHVVKTSFNREFVEQYVEKERKKTLGPRAVFREGREFIAETLGGLPPGSCPWVRDDIRKAFIAFGADGNSGKWNEGGDTLRSCRTDGTRPVYFKIEKVRK